MPQNGRLYMHPPAAYPARSGITMDAAPVRPLVRRVPATSKATLDAARINGLVAQLGEIGRRLERLGRKAPATADAAPASRINDRTRQQIDAIQARAREIYGSGGRTVPPALGKASATADAKAGAAMRAKHDAGVQRLASVQQRFREHWGRQ